MCLAVPGEILSIDDAGDGLMRTGRVSFGGVERTVNLAYVPQAVVGDFVNVHVGFALSVIDAQEAERVFDLLDELGQVDASTDEDEPTP